MTISNHLKAFAGAALSAVMALQPMLAYAEDGPKVIEIAPKSGAEVARHTIRVEDEPRLTETQKLDLLQKHIKYVFVLFQENRSFDFYFGTYPGANGLFSLPAVQTPGFNQPIVNTDGSVSLISPFKIPQTVTATGGSTVLLYPEDTDSVNHGHAAIDAKLHLNAENVAQNDRYAFTEEGLSGTLNFDSSTSTYNYSGPEPTLAQKQKGELVLGHVDCDTAPFLWNYADKFTLFDNFFDTVIGPSTPNAIAMIAGQSGKTQWVKYPTLGNNINTTRHLLVGKSLFNFAMSVLALNGLTMKLSAFAFLAAVTRQDNGSAETITKRIYASLSSERTCSSKSKPLIGSMFQSENGSLAMLAVVRRVCRR